MRPSYPPRRSPPAYPGRAGGGAVDNSTPQGFHLVGTLINTDTYIVDRSCLVWHRDAILQRGVADAKEESVPYRVVSGRIH